MPTVESPPTSPPKGISSSPSIFGYQARLLQRTTSTRTGTSASLLSSPDKSNSLAGMANSPPSTPIRQSVARMAAGYDDAPTRMSNRPGSGGAHMGGGKSVDLVRGQWEAKINATQGDEGSSSRSRRNTVFSPPLPSSSTMSAMTASFSVRTPSLVAMTPEASGYPTASHADSPETSGRYSSSYLVDRAAKRTTVTATDGLGITKLADTPFQDPTSNSIRPRPASISSASILSPTPTGNSVIGSSLTQKQEDTLAQARANALKRLEARKRAQAEAKGEVYVSPSESPAQVMPPPPAPISMGLPSSQHSPFANLFTPPSAGTSFIAASSLDTQSDNTPTSSPRQSYRSFATPPSAPSVAFRYIPSGLSAHSTPLSGSSGTSGSSSTGAGGNNKYGSLSRGDNRRLGRHLPRIASGGEGWEEEDPRPRTERRMPSSLGRDSVVLPSSTGETSSSPSTKTPEPLRPSTSDNVPPQSPPSVPSTPSFIRRSYLAQTPKILTTPSVGGLTPRAEVAGEEMKGLMNAVGALPSRGAGNDEGEGVTGMSNRMRLSRSTLPPSASSAAVAPAPLPSRRLMQSNWMDKQRHALAAYEYLCHVGEAQQWIEGCLDEETGFGVTEMEEGLRDGVVLAKLARVFQGEKVVRKIWTETKHRYKQTDNIDAFIKFMKTVGMPNTFMFDPIDLYDKKNIPKVIFGIHVLSHLLAKQGLAERIGNLVGHFDFTDEQLAKTQKGLQGVAMPNFGDARKTLAKEASWVEPEEPEETEDERRDRELLACQRSIIRLQQHLRGRLARTRASRIQTQLELAQNSVTRLQARGRGALCRRALVKQRDRQALMHDWATAIQATVRGEIATRRWDERVARVRSCERISVSLQALARGRLARKRKMSMAVQVDQATRGMTGLQAVCRGCLARRRRKECAKAMVQPQVATAITSIQARLRGHLHRQREANQLQNLHAQASTFTSLQSHLRGALVRRHIRAHEQKMDDATDYIVGVQSVARGVLARRKKQIFVKLVQHSLPGVSSLQAVARARLAIQAHHTMQKALAKVEVAGSVGGLQAFLRSKLAKKQTTEQKKKLEFVQPDVIGFQALARGYLARQEYREWRDYLQDPHTQGALVFLQSLVRGFLARRRLWIRTSYIHRNVDKVVKIQAVWRGRTERQMYDRLLTGVDVDVPTIQNYMHLLDDTDADYQRQIRTEALRREVVRLLRENQGLEIEVKELDVKIGLITKNKITFEELARAKNMRFRGEGTPNLGSDGGWKDANSKDPFTGQRHLDRASQRKLDLFEHMFFTLQTKGEYLSRLLIELGKDDNGDDKDRRMVEGVMLSLFYGQERREEYLFHKMLQFAVHQEILRSRMMDDLFERRFAITSVATQYIRQIITPYLQAVLYAHVRRVVDTPQLDLTSDPAEIYRRLINEEESRTGMPSQKPRDYDGNQVLQSDEIARGLYIQHLQELRQLTKELVEAMYRSTQGLPYSVRLLAREALLALRVKYPHAMDEDLTPIVARTVVLPFVLPALIAPESFGLSDSAVGPVERRNLAAIANLITLVAAPAHDSPRDFFIRTPLGQYIQAEGTPFRDWILEVASVEPLETFFGADDLLESTVEAKPVMITRTEIYGTLSILIRHITAITGGKANDPLGTVLQELEGPPIDYDRTKNQVCLSLTNRLAELQASDPTAVEKEDWVQAKRHALAVLRVQSGKTLFEVLVAPPTTQDEQIWIDLVHRDMEREMGKKARGDLPPTPVEAEYKIESIRSLPYHEVKTRAIEFCMKLERSGRLARANAFEDLLISIASDIRQKHHLRKMQRQNAVAMEKAHEDLTAKHKGYEEQIKYFHQFIDSSLAGLQKGKKRATFLSKQYFHQRSEARSGRKSKFGTYKYTAADLYQRGILLGINQLSPNVFADVHVVIASNEVGVFSLEMSSSTIPFPTNAVMGREEVRMEDLLQAQYENELNLLLFDGMATFSINLLIHQINKKFYST